MNLQPETNARLAALLPRLASDQDGEIVATVRAIRRTLDRAGLDLHDLAARLATPPEPVPLHDAASGLFEMASYLRMHALCRLTENQADFVIRACGLLASDRALTQKQAKWLRDLYAKHGAAA